jgi:hypothetical protein
MARRSLVPGLWLLLGLCAAPGCSVFSLLAKVGKVASVAGKAGKGAGLAGKALSWGGAAAKLGGATSAALAAERGALALAGLGDDAARGAAYLAREGEVWHIVRAGEAPLSLTDDGARAALSDAGVMQVLLDPSAVLGRELPLPGPGVQVQLPRFGGGLRALLPDAEAVGRWREVGEEAGRQAWDLTQLAMDAADAREALGEALPERGPLDLRVDAPCAPAWAGASPFTPDALEGPGLTLVVGRAAPALPPPDPGRAVLWVAVDDPCAPVDAEGLVALARQQLVEGRLFPLAGLWPAAELRPPGGAGPEPDAVQEAQMTLISGAPFGLRALGWRVGPPVDPLEAQARWVGLGVVTVAALGLAARAANRRRAA